MIYLRLFFEFFKTGLFAVGGGMATIPFLFNLSAKTNWFSIEELANMIAVSESTPGPIGVNMATYVGYNTSGILGSLFATIGLVTPSVIIILIIASLIDKFAEKEIVKSVFKVLRACVIGLIAYAIYSVASLTFFEKSKILLLPTVFYAVLLIIAIKFKKLHPVFIIAIGALIGLIFL